MLRNGIVLLGVLLVVVVLTAPVLAQSSAVYGLFFYAPTCGHCHEVIDNHWPGIQARFGDQLRVLFVDVSTQQGSMLMNAARQEMNIEANGVPMLIIGDTVLVGSLQIPEETPGLVQNGLNNGGIGYPPIEGIDALFEQALAPRGDEAAEGTGEASAAGGASEVNIPQTWQGRFLLDPVANGVAVGVLAALVLSLVVVGAGMAQGGAGAVPALISGNVQRGVLAVAALTGVGLAASLALGSAENMGIVALAATEVLLFVVMLVFILREKPAPGDFSNRLMLLAVVAGLGVSFYLAYVELTVTEAVCGAVGDCNTVQQSAYAKVLGIPIAVIGIIGYAMIMILWALRRTQRREIDVLLLLVVAFGVVFSGYLTFLEPFVIGATCVWCLTSAVVMLLTLWMVAPAAWSALHQQGEGAPA